MLRRVQERHGVGAIPVIMFSGKVDEASADEAAARGAQGFIGKPFDPQQLIESTKQLARRPDPARPPPRALGRPPPRRLARTRSSSTSRAIATEGLLSRDHRRGARAALAPARGSGPARAPPTSPPTGSRSRCGSGSAATARRSSTPSRGRSCRRAAHRLVPVRPRGDAPSPARPCSRGRRRAWPCRSSCSPR